MKDTIGIEEDGDEIITPMPKYCLNWLCYVKQKPLENRNGFMVCPVCNGSYGKIEHETTSKV